LDVVLTALPLPRLVADALILLILRCVGYTLDTVLTRRSLTPITDRVANPGENRTPRARPALRTDAPLALPLRLGDTRHTVCVSWPRTALTDVIALPFVEAAVLIAPVLVALADAFAVFVGVWLADDTMPELRPRTFFTLVVAVERPDVAGRSGPPVLADTATLLVLTGVRDTAHTVSLSWTETAIAERVAPSAIHRTVQPLPPVIAHTPPADIPRTLHTVQTVLLTWARAPRACMPALPKVLLAAMVIVVPIRFTDARPSCVAIGMLDALKASMGAERETLKPCAPLITLPGIRRTRRPGPLKVASTLPVHQ
jgi:hypothetical protein